MRVALRGLALGLALSVLNFVGALLTLLALGGLGDWAPAQFIGLFGLLEVATGVAFVVGPNVWRLPVASAELEPRTRVRLALSTVLIPHWAVGVKSVAGLALLAWAAVQEGIGRGSMGRPMNMPPQPRESRAAQEPLALRRSRYTARLLDTQVPPNPRISDPLHLTIYPCPTIPFPVLASLCGSYQQSHTRVLTHVLTRVLACAHMCSCAFSLLDGLST